ncbi:MAG: ATP-binding protein [Actinomycetota bacterium]|nr:ATP-binding protein [Actinomycetota bacterium]
MGHSSPGLRADRLFPTDSPVPEQMIGRSKDVKELALVLSQGLNQVVGGPRRNGKTTVCQAALEGLARQGAYVVEVDLFQLSDLAALARAIVAGLVANRSAPQRGARKVRLGAEKAVDFASAVATAKLKTAWGPDIEIAFSPHLARDDPRGSFEKALSLLQSVAERDGHDVILFIDEFQKIASPREPFGDADSTTQLMRAVLQRSRGVTSLFAGSVAHLMRDLFDDEKRAFYKFGAWRELGPISTEEWLEGLSKRFQEGGRPITPTAMEYLVARSEGHPRTTMLLAQQCFIAVLETEAREATYEHAILAFDMAMKADAGALAKDIEAIQELSRLAFAVCQAIARGQPPYKVGPSATVARATEALRRAGYIEQFDTPGRGGWVVIEPLLRRRLAEMP